jgi:mxaJ protein
MSSRCHSRAVLRLATLGILSIAIRAGAAAPPLRICSDPDNLPFSSRTLAGFDNRVAMLLARDLGRTPVFVWTRSRRGFMREQFNKNACDVLMGVPVGMKAVATTHPYYRSSYVFVTRAKEHLQFTSFDDPRLNGRRIGLQIMEEDLSPPSLPLIRSGHAGQLVGFESFGAQAEDIVRAVSDKRTGTAVVWGPVAGYYAARQREPLALSFVFPTVDRAGIPFVFSIAVGVHKQDATLRDAMNASLTRLQPKIRNVLEAYKVPTLALDKGDGNEAQSRNPR